MGARLRSTRYEQSELARALWAAGRHKTPRQWDAEVVDGHERMHLTPDDPGLRDLAVVPAAEWPVVAAGWLRRGFASSLLSEFAALSPAQAAEVGELVMPDVLRSLGLSLPTNRPFSVAEVSGFADRCRAALAIVQQDLNRTGYARYVMEVENDSVDGLPVQMVAAISGTGHLASEPMTPDMEDPGELLARAAWSVSETLLELVGSWPRCARHRGTLRLRTHPPDGITSSLDTTHRPWWWCWADEPHAVQPIGELIDAYGTTRRGAL